MVDEKEIIGKQAYLRTESWMWLYDEKRKRRKVTHSSLGPKINSILGRNINSPVLVLAISGAYAMVTEKKGCLPFVCKVKELHTDSI